MKIAVTVNIDNGGVLNVFGHQNRERYSLPEIEAVVDALKSRGHTVEIIEGDRHLADSLEAFMPGASAAETPGLVFNLAYGIQGENRYSHTPATLEMLGVPYVGSGPTAHTLSLDKAVTKMLLRQAGLPTPAFQVFREPDQPLDPELRFPLIVKPVSEAVSFGITVVEDEPAMRAAVASNLVEFSQPTLVEEFLSGKEVNVGILGNGDQIETLPIVEVEFGDATTRLQTFDTKKGLNFHHQCPAKLSPALAETIDRLTREAFLAIGIKDCVRVDFRLDEDDTPYILELNSMPAIHRNGSFTLAAAEAGYSYDDMINRMAEVAMIRYFGADGAAARLERTAGPAAGQISTYVDRRAEEITDGLGRLIDLQGGSEDRDRVNRVGEELAAMITPLGFDLQRFPTTTYGDHLVFKNHDRDGGVILAGHMDTTFRSYDDLPRFHLAGDHAVGPGTADMRGGLVVAIEALRCLRHVGALDRIPVTLIINTDEERGSATSHTLFETQAKQARYAMVFECAGKEGQVVIGRRGKLSARISVEGQAGHAADQDLRKASAIEEVSHKVLALETLNDARPGASFNVGLIEGGIAGNTFPKHASIDFDIRFLERPDRQWVETEVQAIADNNRAPGVKSSLAWTSERPVWEEDSAGPSQQALLDAIEGAARRLSMPFSTEFRYGTSDANFLAGAGVATVDGMGPIGFADHTDREHIILDTLFQRIKQTALVLLSLYP